MRASLFGLWSDFRNSGGYGRADTGPLVPPPPRTYATAADVAAPIANARTLPKPEQTLASESIIGLASYRAALEYRTGEGSSSSHQKEAELIYVIEGGAA